MSYQGDIARALVLEIMEVLYKYEESILAITAVGCLEAAKIQLLHDQTEEYVRRKS
jgi:hypothetical protein